MSSSQKKMILGQKTIIVCFRKTAWAKLDSPGRPGFYFFWSGFTVISSKILIITEGCNNGKDLQWGFPTKNKNQYLTNKPNFLLSEVLICTPRGTKNTVLTPNKITLPCIEEKMVCFAAIPPNSSYDTTLLFAYYP